VSTSLDRLYNFALLDEDAKREIRRSLLKAVALPGHLVPFASRDLPIARGWGTGGASDHHVDHYPGRYAESDRSGGRR
jgi:alpha-D-ribose 1-methylphosphonate 5-phosphate C-P lyase